MPSPPKPELTPRPLKLPCGYAPRSIHLPYGPGERAFYVGCKDGSIHAAIPQPGETPRYRSLAIVRQGLPVRALAEWEEGWLMVGRLGGGIELVDVRRLQAEAGSFPCHALVGLGTAPGEDAAHPEAEAVRALGWVDRGRRFVSYRQHGTRILPFRPVDPDDPAGTLARSWAESVRLEQPGGQALPEALLIMPLRRGEGSLLVLANHRGEVFVWDGRLEGEVGIVEKVPVWARGEEPGSVNDVAVLWSDAERQERGGARGIFLATDRGVYLLYFAAPDGAPGREPELYCRRLALNSLGAVCMSIAYAEPGPEDPSRFGYLWAADSRGDSYLYWTDEREDPAAVNFRSSGISDVGSQAMLAMAWYQGRRLVVGQALRNDQISLNEYEVVERTLHPIRWLLSQGEESDLAPRAESDDPEVQALAELLETSQEWPSYARLADLFEALAADRSHFKILLDFLGEPSPGIAWEILDHLQRDPPAGQSPGAAVRLWTLSLLGILNRPPERLSAAQREAAYLGTIHWLRSLLQKAQAGAGRDELARELEISIQLVRKWGLFGEANSQRKSLVRPLEILRRGGQTEQLLDVLTYEALLLERGVDLLLEERAGHLPGRQAWDVSIAELSGRTFCAISWGWGGVEIYELATPAAPEEGLPATVELDLQLAIPVTKAADGQYEFHLKRYQRRSPGDPGASPAPPIERHKAGYSRAVLLGRVSDGATVRGYLLTAPTPKPSQEPPDVARLRLWPLTLGGRIGAQEALTVDLGAERSVYSLLDLGGGLILAGLGGEQVTPLLALASIACRAGRWALDLLPLHHDDSPDGVTAGSARERVWSLVAVDEGDGPPGPGRRVVLGCDSGKIFVLGLTPEAGNAGWRARWQLVGQMSSSVQALTCRRLAEAPPALRIFAGGTDGSVVAWQEIEAPERAEGRAFTSLWAAHEGAGITDLHLLPVDDPADAGAEAEGDAGDATARRGPHPMLLAITSEERCVFYDDRERSAALAPGSRPARIPFPGCRHGVFQRYRIEPSTAFASALVGLLPNDPQTGRVATLLTASKHGVVRLLTLHYPYFMNLRRRQFRHVVDGWWKAVEENQQLRLIQAVYRAAPSLELILVRWLLDPSIDRPVEGLEAWMLPRNLRSLLEVRKAWESESGPPEAVGDHLARALREAFNLDDLQLFQEICETVLKRGNFGLYAAVRQADRSPRARQIYLEVHDNVERSLRLWRGSPGRQESLARVTVAHNMVDGDTFWSLLDAAAEEMTHPEDGRPKPSNLDVLQRRVQGFRELVFSRDSQVSAEALRSANLSLLRMCKRLVAARPDGGTTWAPLHRQPNPQEALWEGVFEPYFQALTSAASRAFRSRLELNDALALGYARTFALAVCACPSAAMRIATRMTESQLISDPQSAEDLSQRVWRQFQVLERTGIPVPETARQLFRIASRPPQTATAPLADPWLQGALPELGKAGHPAADDSIWRKIGYENALDLYVLGRIYGALAGCVHLEEAFRRSPENVMAALCGLGALPGLDEPDVLRLYGHSAAFWQAAIDALGDLVDRARAVLAEPRQETLRPDTVFLSREIERWATDRLADLRRRYREGQIFQPQFPVYLEVLERLRRAAGAFADSAAVRTKVVQGVLGHHLIEDLDEHILELQEIAHVLDPLLVRAYRRSGELPDVQPEAPIAERFASYLLERSHRAESLPENLRTLFSMLDRDAAGAYAEPTLRQLLAPFVRPELPPPLQFTVDAPAPAWAHPLEPEEIRYLRLILQELARNHANHSSTRQGPAVEVSLPAGPAERLALGLAFEFPVAADEAREFELYRRLPAGERPPRGNLERLHWLREHALQTPIEPRPERTIKSSGMGLYLANFAAAIVGWKLRLESVGLEAGRGLCRFRLEQVAGVRSRGGVA